MKVHPTAIVSERCELGKSVEIGPYAVIEGAVKIGDGTKIDSHARIGYEFSDITIGKNNHIYPYSFLGGAPQDTSYDGYETKLVVGDNNIFRECVTVNTGTKKENKTTIIGNDCMLMAYVHIAHDCELGDRVIIANTTNFAGHVKVADDVRIGGACNFAQFLRLGKYAYIAGDTTANKDILPYTMAEGKWAISRATNKVGLKRSGQFKAEHIDDINRAIRFLLKGHRTIEEAVEKINLECQVEDEHIKYLLDFINTSEKGIAR